MVKLYVEGGGDSASLKSECRRGFREFLEKAGLQGKMPQIIACGSRNDAFDSFCTGLNNGEHALLLIDSESPVSDQHQIGKDCDLWLPWLHLAERKGDEWTQPHNSTNLSCHFMVQCMESWLIVDHACLSSFFGIGFKSNQLPNAANQIEKIPKSEIYRSLKIASRSCKTKSQYNKGNHSFKLLALVDPQKIVNASPWAKRFVDHLLKVSL